MEGLGFRDTQCFNQTMLCKQAWKLLSEPHSYLSRVFKARYFPQGDFLSASLGAKPSYIWRSILSVRDIMHHGIKWMLGNRQITNLIDEEIGVWDLDKVMSIFYPVDCEAILKISLGRAHLPDIPTWGCTKSGIFSVKLAYQLAISIKSPNSRATSISSGSHNIFKSIWKLKIQRKVRHFVYRAVNNRLATVDNLLKRNEENGQHLFHSCKFVKEIYNILHINEFQRNRKFRGQPFRIPSDIVKFGISFLELEDSAFTKLNELHQQLQDPSPFLF
ncbi:hypothetical protein LIER_10215 [Lithospermum erythrorhizon]|uniref:Reverse transcriptase zinc-binding domain-containing protein n=1 Tax=Lithospermum erythrorhizon TaxID=34254 RepID=A0AAV3PIL9_LITER